MKNMNDLIVITAFICLLIPFTGFGLGNQEQDPVIKEPIVFWEFICKDESGLVRTLAYNEIFEITSDFQYQLHISAKYNLFLYVFLYDRENHLTMLFPADVHSLGLQIQPGSILSLPENENQWLSLEKGQQIQNLYILASLEKAKKLEQYAKQYIASLSDPGVNQIQEDSLKNNLLEEIIRMNRLTNQFVKQTENPETFSGTMQNDNSTTELEWFIEDE